MSSAGQQLVAGRIPGERIATTIETSASAAFTTETIILSVEFPAVIGRTYAVKVYCRMSSTVDNDDVLLRVRSDDASGAGLGDCAQELTLDDQEGQGVPFWIYTEYTADVTENKTIVVTGQRHAGTGNITLNASGSTRRAFLFVDYVSG